MISIKSEREIALMEKAGHINYLTHEELKKYIKPGITTKKLDEIAYNFIISHNGYPSQLHYEGYPASICVSINDEVVHGIPSNRKIKNGDIVSIDFCVSYKGYQSDSARTYIVGTGTKEAEELVIHTKKALEEALKIIKAGVRIGDIGAVISDYAHKHHLSVVEDLVGHGLGTDIHEEPDVPNFGTAGTGLKLKEGMVIAVEPMLTTGSKEVCMLEEDDWTIVTEDESLSAHFEHTVLVTKDGCRILTGE